MPASQVVIWTKQYWIVGAALAMGVGIAQLLSAAVKGDAMPILKVVANLWSSLLGGLIFILLGRSFNLDPDMIMALAALGGGMGIQTVELGKEVLIQRFNLRVERRKDE